MAKKLANSKWEEYINKFNSYKGKSAFKDSIFYHKIFITIEREWKR